MSDWLDDLDDSGGSLFADNLARMVEDGSVESLNPQTIIDQLDEVDDPDLLEQAIDQDTRDDVVEAYEERLAAIEDDPEPVEETEDEATEDTEETEETADEAPDAEDDGAGDADAVVDGSPTEESEGDAQDDADGVESASPAEEDPTPADPAETDGGATAAAEAASDGGDLPVVDVSTLAPDAIGRAEAIDEIADSPKTLLVWGEEGTGKSHVAHSAPEPVCYIDTEGKAEQLADKFDKQIVYFRPDDYQEAKAAMEQALDVLAAYLDEGVRGTLVVDSMTVMWEWAQIDYALWAYQTDDLTEVNFQGVVEDDWKQIKARHNANFREVILDSPYNVVFTAGEKDKYEVENDYETKKTADGERHNKYAVKDVVRLRHNRHGNTVGDLYKAARTRYAFEGLEWPEWDDIYAAIEEITQAELADAPVDVSQWDFDVVEGQPVAEAPDKGGGDE